MVRDKWANDICDHCGKRWRDHFCQVDQETHTWSLEDEDDVITVQLALEDWREKHLQTLQTTTCEEEAKVAGAEVGICNKLLKEIKGYLFADENN